MRPETMPAVYAKLDNRPGTLEHVTRVLREKRINIEAMSVETVGSTGFARILTPKSQQALDALRGAGVEAYDTHFLVVKPENKAGALNRLASELAAAGLNVEAVLTTPEGRVAIRTNDNEAASRILGKL